MTEIAETRQDLYTPYRQAQSVVDTVRDHARGFAKVEYEDETAAKAAAAILTTRFQETIDSLPFPLMSVPFYAEGGILLPELIVEDDEDSVSVELSKERGNSRDLFELSSGIDDAHIQGVSIALRQTESGYRVVPTIVLASDMLKRTVEISAVGIVIASVAIDRALVFDPASKDVLVAEKIKRLEEQRQLRDHMKRTRLDVTPFARSVRRLDRAIHAETDSDFIDLRKTRLIRQIAQHSTQALEENDRFESDVPSALSMVFGRGRDIGVTTGVEGATSVHTLIGKFLDTIVLPDKKIAIVFEAQNVDGSTSVVSAPLDSIKGLKY